MPLKTILFPQVGNNVSPPRIGAVYSVAIKTSTRSARRLSATSVLKPEARRSQRTSHCLRPTVALKPPQPSAQSVMPLSLESSGPKPHWFKPHWVQVEYCDRV